MSLFICPLCHSPLIPAADTWRCDGSQNPHATCHPFDVARQGYVNLLPVQQKKSKAPGDSAASIMARQRFLAQGHYAPLQAQIVSIMSDILGQHRQTEQQGWSKNWLDIGCGEGYYTQAMAHTGMNTLIAADISKPAVLALAKASKAEKRLWYQRQEAEAVQIAEAESARPAAVYPLVTSAAHLPIKAGSITGISSIFSPILPRVFAQTLQDDGYLIIAKPDGGHLASVRRALFEDVREHDSDKFLDELAPYFAVMDTRHVATDLALSADDLADLLTMTPYSYRAKAAKRATLLDSAKQAAFCTQARFVVYVLKKHCND